MFDRVMSYQRAGLCVLPALRDEKRPGLPRWKKFQKRLPTEQELQAWFTDADAACLITGAVSGNLELLDFDLGGELFEPWAERVRQRSPGLLDRLTIERSQSGGRHVVYRCAETVCGNLKLAQRAIVTPDDRPVIVAGKAFRPRRRGDQYQVIISLIETRGEGGLFLCDPTPGYELLQGQFEDLPVLTAEERGCLLDTAWSLNEWYESVSETLPAGASETRPGDDFNTRGDVRAILRQHGWTLALSGENEHWRRPGKDSGWSATLKGSVFYVFSSNAAPFEPNRGYSPFAVYAALEHDGDFTAAARMLQQQGYGQNMPEPDDVDLSGLLPQTRASVDRADDPPAAPTLEDPGPLPDELLRVPGFVSEVMDYCLATAPYPNQVMAFCGALSLQAFLAGRRVRDPGDNRTNIYLLGLAHSAAGKDWPRKVNTRIVNEAGLADCLGDRFASGEGLQDALFVNPCMLFASLS